MLFDSATTSSNSGAADSLVIVPPKPDALLSRHEEFTYSNLYFHDDVYGYGSLSDYGCGALTSATVETTSSGGGGSAATLSSSSSSANSGGGIASESNTSFDSSAFVRPSNNNNNNNNNNSSSSSGTNNDDDNANGGTHNDSSALTNELSVTRDPRNGAFTFQVHGEYDLLLHVQRDLDRYRKANANSNKIDDGAAAAEPAEVRLSNAIMRSVDEYCLRKQWMYHIGREKGLAVGRFLRKGVDSFVERHGGKEEGGQVKKFVCVDLGTYCGYSALVLASTLCQIAHEYRQQQQGPFEFHVYTTEISSKLLNVAQSIFRLARVENFITSILVKGDGKELLSEALQQHDISHVDFILFDHDKPSYLHDLQDLERSGLIKEGSRVAADNVVFNRLDEYRDHVRDLTEGGYANSRLEEMNLEYSNNLKDGIEMTMYLKDPPIAN